MSRIQDILTKAEREGTARRTRSLGDPVPTAGPGPRPARTAAPAAPPRSRSSAAEALDAEPVSQDALARGAAYSLDPHLVAALAPHSLAAEQYRSLRTRINAAQAGRRIQSIAITSPSKGDGKSLTAANLAVTMAQEFQQRVLLVDADLRRPTVHRMFGVADVPGLTDVLMGAAEVDQALIALPEHHLTLLPAGAPPGHPAELLGSAAMRRVVDTLRTRFDRIVFDMPPVAPLADVHILSPVMDALLLIVRAGFTPKPAIEQALEALDRTKVLGLVLNETGGSITNKYNYDGYGYIAG